MSAGDSVMPVVELPPSELARRLFEFQFVALPTRSASTAPPQMEICACPAALSGCSWVFAPVSPPIVAIMKGDTHDRQSD